MPNKSKVLFIGDSRKMKGGVSTVMKSLETSWLWKEYQCFWLETQVNSHKVLKAIYLLWAWCRSLYVVPRYDIAHFQTVPGLSMITLLPVYLYSLLLKKRIVVQLHVGNQIQAYTSNRFFRFWTRHADEVLFLGKMWAEQTRPYINKSVKIDYLYNPTIDTQNPHKPEKYFLFAAFLNENKGYDIFLKAFAKIAKSNPDWKAVLCGTGDNARIEELIVSLGIKDSVIRPGWVEGETKADYFRKAYAYCMASWMEGLPLSVLEAMAYGVPVIATPVGCLPEFLKNGESACLFDFGNIDMLADAMQTLIDEPEKRNEMGNACQQIINERFTLGKVCEKLDSIYQTL